MLFETNQLIIALLCALLIGMAKGGLAGGLGTLVVPVMSLSMDPRIAAALTLPILIISDWFAITAYWNKGHTGHLKVLLIGAVLGILVGTLTFQFVSEPMMRLLMGVLAIGFVLSRWFGASPTAETPQDEDLGPGVFWGSVSGFTSFTAHAGGPQFQIYMMPKGQDKLTFQATNVIFFTVVNLVKVPPYIMLGQFTQPLLLSALALMPAAAVGVFLGYRLQNKLPEKLFFQIMNLLLFLTGLKLAWDGTRALGWL